MLNVFISRYLSKTWYNAIKGDISLLIKTKQNITIKIKRKKTGKHEKILKHVSRVEGIF